MNQMRWNHGKDELNPHGAHPFTSLCCRCGACIRMWRIASVLSVCILFCWTSGKNNWMVCEVALQRQQVARVLAAAAAAAAAVASSLPGARQRPAPAFLLLHRSMWHTRCKHTLLHYLGPPALLIGRPCSLYCNAPCALNTSPAFVLLCIHSVLSYRLWVSGVRAHPPPQLLVTERKTLGGARSRLPPT